MKTETATFAGGCFWHIQDAFSQLNGVIKTLAGYTGGKIDNPTYEQVSTGKTGHVESVEVTYDSDKISYSDLLKEFFKMHDPTTLNRQGPDTGEQYNSVIFYHNQEQKEMAENYKQELIKSGSNIVTKIVKADKFYPAEDYHQDYFKKRNIVGGGCSII